MLLPDGRHVSHNPAILPLKIWVDRSARKWGTAVERAAAIWNSLVKEELFQFVGTSTTTRSPDTGEVVIFGLVSQAESQADTHFYVDRETGYYTLTFITVPILTEAYLESITIIMHELGHVLGLDHDPQLPDSLMHPVIKTPLLLPTDSDLEVIKSTYFPARNPQEK